MCLSSELPLRETRSSFVFRAARGIRIPRSASCAWPSYDTLKSEPRCHGLARELAQHSIDSVKIRRTRKPYPTCLPIFRCCATAMSLFIRAVPATSPTDGLHNACTSSFRTRNNGLEPRPVRAGTPFTRAAQISESRLVATRWESVQSAFSQAQRHDFR